MRARNPRVLNPPDRIWLQVGEIESDCEFVACSGGDVTFSTTPHFRTDIEYRLVKRRRTKKEQSK